MRSFPATLSPDSLMEEATARSGSDDWGDWPFKEALRLLVDACADGGMSELGWRVLRGTALRHLGNVLAVQEYVKSHPEVRSGGIGRPIVVTGLPRTATTALLDLLALDPENRTLHLWEALLPVPPPDAAGRAERIARAQRWLERFYDVVPAFRRVHALRDDGPEECDALLQNSFASQHFNDMFDAPAYSEWFGAAPLEDEYAHYALQLRVLASGDATAGNWVLKSPGHLGHLDAVLRVLPDALVVHCHRDPLVAVSSYASLISTLRAAYYERQDPVRVGEQALQRCAAAMTRALAVRESVTPGTFIDVAYDLVVREPLTAVSAIYAAAGRTLGAEARECMREWALHNPRGALGEHRYSHEAFGLDDARVAAAFGAYRERFGPMLR